MKQSLLLLTLLMGGMSLSSQAADYMSPATLVSPASEEYLRAPTSAEFTYNNQKLELIDGLMSEYEGEYVVLEVSINEEEPVDVNAYYIYSEPWLDDEGNVILEEDSFIHVALYELYDEGVDLDSAESIVITIPEGIFANEAGEINPAQTLTLTLSPYAGFDYFFDLTYSPMSEDPDEIPVLTQGDAIVTVSCGGYPIEYLQDKIGFNNYTENSFGSLDFGDEVTINDKNELVIDLSEQALGEVEIMLPEAYLLVDVDGEKQLSASLYLNYIIEEGESDGIKSLGTDNAPRRIYTLKGVRVESNGKLVPGLYIINGKKVLVK